MAVELAIGHVAGLIALAFVIARALSPTVLAFIMAGQLGDRENAATWTVAAKTLQSSFWPFILRSDSSKDHAVRKEVLYISLSVPTMTFLMAVAGVVTPLGLYEATSLSSRPTSATFRYLPDTNGFLNATSPRGDDEFTRICWRDMDCIFPCPYTNDFIVIEGDDSQYSSSCDEVPIDANIPAILRDIFTSGTSTLSTTVSNYFDIGWRQLTKVNFTGVNNGALTDRGSFRFLDSFALDDSIHLVEGLIVDGPNGGIGFRNHTIPHGFRRGAEWSEDLLFLEAETECVDTNTTIDFTIASGSADSSGFTLLNISLVDRGGFVNLARESPRQYLRNDENKPDLRMRAYVAAWLYNAATMLRWEVATPGDEDNPLDSLSSVDSEIGNQFEMLNESPSSVDEYLSLGMSPNFDQYIVGSPFIDSDADDSPPWNITEYTFQDIEMACEVTDYLFITAPNTTYVACTLLRGTPKRVDGGQTFVMGEESQWSSPLYVCASAPKATVKTVRFFANDTESASTLDSLEVLSIKDKEYASEEDMPLWGIEAWGWSLRSMEPIWGLVNSAYEGFPNIATVRQPSLYLMGSAKEYLATSLSSFLPMDNLPASIASTRALGTATQGSYGTTDDSLDITGSTRLKLWLKWQRLSESSETVGNIISLLFADVSASAMVGTKGMLNAAATAGGSNAGAPHIDVFPYVHQIKYNILFGIPAFVVAGCLLVVHGLAVLSAIRRISSIQRTDRRVKQTSMGRVLASIFYPQTSNFEMSSTEWSDKNGEREFDFRRVEPEAASEVAPMMVTHEHVEQPKVDKPTMNFSKPTRFSLQNERPEG